MVEQGTENPRVGGSTPSLATITLLVVSALLGAACSDQCEALCTETTTELKACLDGWPADWEDLDASGRRDFRETCQSRWSAVRADLEARELDDALDQCKQARTDLLLMEDEATCDTIRALYMGQ